jgi:NAD-dependent DNA ligase
MIRGIGPVYAKKLVRAFGEKVFDVIEAEPDRLRAVDGIGAVRAGRITAAWSEQKAELHFSASSARVISAPWGIPDKTVRKRDEDSFHRYNAPGFDN